MYEYWYKPSESGNTGYVPRNHRPAAEKESIGSRQFREAEQKMASQRHHMQVAWTEALISFDGCSLFYVCSVMKRHVVKVDCKDNVPLIVSYVIPFHPLPMRYPMIFPKIIINGHANNFANGNVARLFLFVVA